MKEIYDLQKHTHFVVIYMQNGGSYIEIFPNLNRSHLSPDDRENSGNFITHNSQRDYAVSYKTSRKNGIRVDSFMEGLYRTFKKGKHNWDKSDKFLMQTVSDFISSKVKKLIEDSKSNILGLDMLHYAFIVPSDWKENIREEIIRPIFIQSELISSEDHQDRLLFFTDIESTCYKLQKNSSTVNSFKRGRNTVFCKFSCVKDDVALIKLDLIKTTNHLFNFSGSMLFPKVTNSISLSFSAEYIKSSLKTFLREKLLPIRDGANQEPKSIRGFLKTKLFPVDHDRIIIDILAEEIYNGELPDLDTYNKDNSKTKHWIRTKKRWMLNKNQKAAIKSIHPNEIYFKIGKPLFDSMRDILSNDFQKENFLVPFENSYSTSLYSKKCLLKWLYCILEYNRRSLNSITRMTRVDIPLHPFHLGVVTEGAGYGVLEAVKSSNMNSKPRILSTDILDVSSSVFINSRVNAIIDINISLKLTTLTLSILKCDGLIEKVFDHNYFTNERNLPSLESFYQVSHVTSLTVKESFIPFADKYLIDDISGAEDKLAKNKKSMSEIEILLRKDISNNEALVSTEQKVYIKAFLLMYMSYIKDIISNMLPDDMSCDTMNIGYVVSIEKVFLDSIIETINSFEEIIYTSGLVQKDDNYKKLRIITQEERMSPAIQKYLNLELPLKSYFVLVQLYENYIQLTLNQTVTCPDLKEQHESIIIENKIVPIQNMCDSLCLNLWNNLLENGDSIQLCDVHNWKDSSNILELFSLEAKKEFESNLKRYISENIFADNTDPYCDNKFVLKINTSCSCELNLSADDIIEVSFKPVLEDIAYYVSTSLIKKDIFGSYEDIHYVFSLLCFKYKLRFQHKFKSILQEKLDHFNREQGIYTHSLIIPALSSLILQPVLKQRPYMYQSFCEGAFRQVSSENYAFVINQISSGGSKLLFKNRRTDTVEFEYGEDNILPFLKKGDAVSNILLKRVFYLKVQKHTNDWCISIKLFKYKTPDNLESKGTTVSLSDGAELVNETLRWFRYNDFKSYEYIPLIISVRSRGHSSSLIFSLKLVGEDINRNKSMEQESR